VHVDPLVSAARDTGGSGEPVLRLDDVELLKPDRFGGPDRRRGVVRVVGVLDDRHDGLQARREHTVDPGDALGCQHRLQDAADRLGAITLDEPLNCVRHGRHDSVLIVPMSGDGVPGRFVGDRYHLVRELGRGGMGVVYLGRDLRLDMDVAIKFRAVSHSDATLWIKREFRAVSSLRHPNLVELYELVAHEKSCYFTMEYLPGLDPRRWVEAADSVPLSPLLTDAQTRTAVPLQEAHTELTITPLEDSDDLTAIRAVPNVDMSRVRGVLAQLAEGLAFLHASGVIHRDVKPSNAIVVDGAVKLLDFGLALEQRRQEDDLARENRVVGTAAYLAPEYLGRLQVSPALDVYALGVLAFELISGAPPFGGTMHLLSRLGKQVVIPKLSSFNPQTPPDLDALVERMLAADPDERPTALDIATQLSGTLSQPRMPRRAPRFIGRNGELAQLARLIADPKPEARLVLVTGPSGVGKSSLIEEAVARAKDAETIMWRARCHERERIPYRAFDLIIDDIATELSEDPRRARDIAHTAALGRVFPVLAPLIDPIYNEPAAADLRVERDRALFAMCELFRDLLRMPRGLIVIDDLQWADEDSLELLALLVERIDRPLTIVASWTTDEPLSATAMSLLERLGPRTSIVEVTAMTTDELAQMIADLAPSAPAARLVAAAKLAAGSPYLAELIGRELGEADGSAGNMLDAEARRLARLPPAERIVAEIAALAGGTASFEQLRALAALPSERLQSALRGLEDARIVRATPSTSGDPVYVFYHQRLRDVATDGMDPIVRAQHHRKFVDWFEKTAGDPGQLAYHAQLAGDIPAAARYALAAADAARRQLAWNIADIWYSKALDLGAEAARAGRAEMRFLGGKLARAAEDFLILARDSDDDLWRVRAAESYLKLGEIERAFDVLDGVLERRGARRARSRAASVVRAVAVATRWMLPATPRPVDPVLTSAYRVIASFLSTPHPIEAFEYVLRGVALADRAGDREAHGQGMAILAAYLAAGTLGRFGDRALAAARRASDAPYAVMVAAGAEGILCALRGDWARMRGSHEEAERICKRLGLERTWEASFLKSYWALGELYAGEPVRAIAMLDALADTADDHFSRAMIGSWLGRAHVLAGDLPRARAIHRELAPQRGMGLVYRNVFAGELALAEHDWHRARTIAQALAADTRAQWLSMMPAISAMTDVIHATAELGLSQAASARTIARRLHRRGRSSFYAATALRLWSQAEAQLGNHARARALLDKARRVARERGSKIDQLAIAALGRERVDAGPLAAAVVWSTAGAVQCHP
jgi:serine/threonine protein kinase